MDVVGGAADGLRENRVIFANAGDVGPENWLKFFGDGFAAVFSAEDNVDGVLREGVRHGAGYSIGGTRFRERNARSGAGICTYEACVAPTALRVLRAYLSHRFRGGLAYAAPTALVWSCGDATRSEWRCGVCAQRSGHGYVLGICRTSHRTCHRQVLRIKRRSGFVLRIYPPLPR